MTRPVRPSAYFVLEQNLAIGTANVELLEVSKSRYQVTVEPTITAVFSSVFGPVTGKMIDLKEPYVLFSAFYTLVANQAHSPLVQQPLALFCSVVIFHPK